MKFKENCIVPVPVTLNCWKHHAGFIKQQIILYKRNNIKGSELKRSLLIIGNSQIDIYFGKLSPEKIAEEIIMKLKNNYILLPGLYNKRIEENKKKYMLSAISDKSVWTLRIGNQSNRYIHIHPGRYSPFTLRVKALTLKTAVTVLVESNNEVNKLDVNFINSIRKNYWNMSPLKSISYSSGLGKFITLLNCN